MMELYYEGNDKHKKPWQRGRKGSLCPNDKRDLDPEQLLRQSEIIGKKRYAVFDGQAFAAQRHEILNDKEMWHGYPVGWVEVPPELRHKWVSEKKVTKKQLRDRWEFNAQDDES